MIVFTNSFLQFWILGNPHHLGLPFMICVPRALRGSVSTTLTAVLNLSLHLPCFSSFCSQPHRRFVNVWGIFLVYFYSMHWQTVHRSDAGTAPSCSQQPVFPVLGERKRAEPPQAGDPPFCVEISWVPSTGCCFGTKEYRRRRDMEGGADARVNEKCSGFFFFFFEIFLTWEYLLWSVALIHWVTVHIIEPQTVSCYTQHDRYM